MGLYGRRTEGCMVEVVLLYRPPPIEPDLALPLLELGHFQPCRGLFKSALKLRGLGGVTRPPHVLLLPCKW